MLGRSLLSRLAGDERLTRHLGDAEARILVEWLVDRAERLDAEAAVDALVRRGRAIAKFVSLWCIEDDRGAASQLAASERFHWPLPAGPVDPWRLMRHILTWEEDEPARGGPWAA